ncbi:MAG: FtsX-like permease family protein [Cyanothece sp. SIO1E1]|nr:FtsX-like permease family protein [Cyanothece sp. SIO1E1]
MAELGSLPVELVGLTNHLQSMASSTFLLTSLENAKAYIRAGLVPKVNCRLENGDFKCTTSFKSADDEESEQPANGNQSTVEAPDPLNAADPITYVLVKAQRGQDLQALKQRLEAALPGTKTHTKDELLDLTQTYWQQRTSVGFILGLGAGVGVIVGIVIVGQILYANVSDHIKEFGTLKAMGASDWVIYGVIVEQALWMAVLGYLPSIVLCWGLGVWTLTTRGLMILITPTTAVGIFGVTLVMCVGAAVFAIQKVTQVDPASVFKA